MRQLGGMERSYEVVRAARDADPHMDPRELLKKGAQVCGVKLTEVSARGLRELLRGKAPRRKPPTELAKKVARRMRRAFAKLLVAARLRVHAHEGFACVETHFPVHGAETLLLMLKNAVPAPAT